MRSCQDSLPEITVPRRSKRPAGSARRRRPIATSQQVRLAASCCGRRKQGGHHDRLSRLPRHGSRRWRGLRPCPGAVPGPPLIALVGLLGMVLGGHAIDMVQHHPAAPRGLVPAGLRRCPRISLARLRALAPHDGYRPNPVFAEARRPRRGDGRTRAERNRQVPIKVTL
jgi:hypothetical protein